MLFSIFYHQASFTVINSKIFRKTRKSIFFNEKLGLAFQLLTKLTIMFSVASESKEWLGGCRCGQNSKRKRQATPTRTYNNKNRCKCAKANILCTELCNCHGECGGKMCGGSSKDQSSKRKGRERTCHKLQDVKLHPTSKSFLDNSKESVNPGKLNMLEYVIVCSSILFLEENKDEAHILDVQIYYDKLIAITTKYNLLLPITDRSERHFQSGKLFQTDYFHFIMVSL